MLTEDIKQALEAEVARLTQEVHDYKENSAHFLRQLENTNHDAARLANIADKYKYGNAKLRAEVARLTQERDECRKVLVDHWESDGDESMAHRVMHDESLKVAIVSTIAAYETVIEWHDAQDGLLTEAQEETCKLREQLAEIQRPLDSQMERLNARLIEANADNAKLRRCVEAAKAMRADSDCPMCDRGKLRNPEKEHWDTCAFAAFDAAIAALDKPNPV